LLLEVDVLGTELDFLLLVAVFDQELADVSFEGSLLRWSFIV
jgi:hypothetical protein